MKWLLVTSVVCWLISVKPVLSQTITIDRPLDFGRFVMVDNNAPRSITLLSGGGFIADPQFIFFSQPEMGSVTVDGYPASTTLNVSVGIIDLNNGANIPNFSTSSTFTNPAIVTTDSTGTITFDVGATLSSDGGGATHSDGLHSGMFTVTVTP